MTQHVMFNNAFAKEASRNATWLELLPTLTRAELENLIIKRPELWKRFEAYLTSGYKFVGE